jgi:hypothetical protein
VRPYVDARVRGLCARPYPLHSRGCPNFRKKRGCPPDAPMLYDVYDLTLATYAIWNVFALGDHVRSMRSRYPGWSERQLYCCLYWQPRARAQLEAEIAEFLKNGTRLVGADLVTRCPEAMGLDVTATMRTIRSQDNGVDLEWPPVERAVQVAFAGVGKKVV